MTTAIYVLAAAIILAAVLNLIGTFRMVQSSTTSAASMDANTVSLAALTTAVDGVVNGAGQLIAIINTAVAELKQIGANAGNQAPADISIQVNALADRLNQEATAIGAAVSGAASVVSAGSSTSSGTDDGGGSGVQGGGSAVTIILGAELPSGVMGQDYTAQLTASGGTGPYTFSTVDPVPDGLSISITGALTGTPTEAGDFSWNVSAADANGVTGSGTVEFTITAS